MHERVRVHEGCTTRREQVMSGTDLDRASRTGKAEDMASRVISRKFLATGYVVRVEHLDTDSFSRSVDRAASRAWRTDGVQFQHVTGSYAHGHVGTDPRTGREVCVSTIVYAHSFTEAEEILAADGLRRGVA